jgi:CheY-like chemotaxis protein
MPRVLVVEDSPTQAQLIQLMLEGEGYVVERAGQGLEALAAIARSVPDVVLTDLDMPAMNGLELVQAVRGKYPFVPVILMTALGSEEIAVRALRGGAAYYIPKARLEQEVVAALESVLAVAAASTWC